MRSSFCLFGSLFSILTFKSTERSSKNFEQTSRLRYSYQRPNFCFFFKQLTTISGKGYICRCEHRWHYLLHGSKTMRENRCGKITKLSLRKCLYKIKRQYGVREKKKNPLDVGVVATDTGPLELGTWFWSAGRINALISCEIYRQQVPMQICNFMVL